MKQDIQISILELQLRRSKLLYEIKEIDLQLEFLREQIEQDKN
jgi:predicted ATP-grasp superfamily ATP-dependent carboligase